ncbi:GNAT family N-acetyltransferase [Siminovitchia terrae]|uniref:GNAT family N-acetyltransferase n=1 Tax=Siminovitchia terrae TaxID=1914933 RepID=A0A429XB58_SIMTE|nr:GNAT family N-acetyltransferase [Siminovitchia terrae]RST60640.1 GNAT family N-acetyltransferase [Siminovitchia terrae]
MVFAVRVIRKLTEEDFEKYVPLIRGAFPDTEFDLPVTGGNLRERFVMAHNQDNSSEFYGLFEDETLLGSMRLHHYTMNVFSHPLPVGGVGLVAVDIMRKKEKVGRDLLSYFLRYYREREVSITLLSPFRVDFYKQLGFGVGTKVNQYRVNPSHFQNRGTKKHIIRVTELDQELVLDCYQRYTELTHGMIAKTEMEAKLMFADPDDHIVAYKKDGRIEGYLVFKFKRLCPEDNFSAYDLIVKEFIYETPEAFSELCTFLSSQADQIQRIILNTQDEDFHHLLVDPSNGYDNLLPESNIQIHQTGVGIMYRIINVPKLFADLSDHNFGGKTLTVEIRVLDKLLPENEGNTLVHFQGGRASLLDEGTPDVTIELDIANFSSLIMGAVSFQKLHDYSLVKVSDPRFKKELDQLFQPVQKPSCMTSF